MATLRILKILLLLLVPGFASAQTKYADPDSPSVQAAARAALPRAKVLDIGTKVLAIVGTASGVESELPKSPPSAAAPSPAVRS